MVADEHQAFAMTDSGYTIPRELHVLKQIDADLRGACTRLWSRSRGPTTTRSMTGGPRR
jgi:hypothetical protein